jgi:DNA-directed RNA polymerase specialized sigma subunit
MATEYLNNKFFENVICKFQITKKQKAMYELIIEDLLDMTKRKKERKISCSEDKIQLEENKKTYQNVSDEHFVSKQELALAFYTLSENIVNYARFNLIDPDDAVQEGVMICFEKIDRFDPRKGKAFNYMTTCILNHFRQLYRTARNYDALKKKYLRYLQAIENKILIKNGKEITNWKPFSS